MIPFPLTPDEAIAVAAILEARLHKLPPGVVDHWSAIIDRLRTWGRANLERAES